ncbi:MAG: hypothetical protein A2W29_04535 [Gemmatimonadetes bacterium RBG_16_66_8]|nr:MAG: hypothetical protein A2W29_04535 [Gemmatimonadetes bacterium RBG_16_66_8]
MNGGLTQRTLAERLGCWPQSVAAWEWDESEPLAGRWPAIEAVLGPGLVLTGEGIPGRLRASRLSLGLTQQEVAERAGVDVRTVRNAERGVWRPSRLTLAKLGRVFDFSA